MAVFLINICKFNGCGITFPSLGDLIQHIEDTHIDYDPKVVEQKEQAQPACLPLSYVLRFISEDARKETSFIASTPTGVELKRKLAIKHHSYSMSSSNRSNTPTGSEMDEDEMVVTESEDSNDSWTTEEFSSEFIMRYGSRHSGTGGNGTPGNEKPFACPVPGCKKRYKNVNGIKYHSKNGHKKDGKVRKGYKCHCGKSYKTAQGLKNHALAAHNSTPESTLTTHHIVATSGGVLMPRSSSPSQSLGSLSPSSISNMSSSASSCHGGGVNANVQNVSNNILQHLTNGVTATITGNIVTANGIGNGSIVSTLGNTIQINQHQFAITNANQQHIAQQPASCLPISEMYHALSDHALLFAATRTPIPRPVPSKSTTTADNLNVAPSNPLHPPLNVSTTFIEHKYSAKKYKEKFYANIRHDDNSNSNSKSNSNSNSNSDGKIKSDILPKSRSFDCTVPVQACNMTQSSNEVHSSMYELNENFKNIST